MIHYKKVHPKDYNGEQLMELARVGILYIDTTKLVSLEEVIDNVREYVGRIRSLVTSRFRSSIDDIWEDIFCCEELRELIMPNNKARNGVDFNKVGIKGIICVLQNNGVYENYSSLKLERQLEKSEKESSSRRYLTQGVRKRELQIKIRQIVEKYKD